MLLVVRMVEENIICRTTDYLLKAKEKLTIKSAAMYIQASSSREAYHRFQVDGGFCLAHLVNLLHALFQTCCMHLGPETSILFHATCLVSYPYKPM